MTKPTKNTTMLNITKSLLGRLLFRTSQINYVVVLGKYLNSLDRSNRICRCYWNAFARRGGNLSVTDTNTPNSPILGTILLSGEKYNLFLPIKEQLPTSLFISVRALQGCAGAVCWTEMSLGPGGCALMGSLCHRAGQTHLSLMKPTPWKGNLTRPISGKLFHQPPWLGASLQLQFHKPIKGISLMRAQWRQRKDIP